MTFNYQQQQPQQSWAPPDPLPTLNGRVPQGAGASAAVYSAAMFAYQQESATWQPPDPLPTLPHWLKHVTAGFYPLPVPPPVPARGGSYPPRNVSAFGATPTYVTYPTPTGALFPAAGLANTISGLTALVIGPCNGGFVTNPATAAAQGLGSTENIYLDLVNLPGNSDATAYGTTVLIAAGQTFTIPQLSAGVTLWANAPSAGHHVSVTVW